MAKVDQTLEDEGEKVGKGIWIWVSLGLLLFYPLSTGPVCRMAQAGLLPRKFIMVVYEPLKPAYDGIRPFHVFLDWYMNVWGVK